MTRAVVVVESPAKAKTINKYLGSDYTVLASYGHIRDLPPKDGSVDPENNFEMLWQLSDRAGKPVSEIVRALKGADTLYLASDPDREGEAIAWHVEKVLRDKGALKTATVHRITFNEITKTAVKHAVDNPRALDTALIDAYLARRALDYLVGFSLSPVLWRKLPGAKSAGRVQSVALRLICERESEIEVFQREEYWTIGAVFDSPSKQPVPARLTALDGKKLDKFAITNEADAKATVARLQQKDWRVTAVDKRESRRNPAPPFTTSTLQQEAARKLYFGATKTMRTAQSLYEGADIGGETVGLITYMRTDGVQMAGEAIAAVRDLIGKDYGNSYVPPAARVYTSKAKNAQEAHEAVRPTDVQRRPADVARYLSDDELKLYTLIWQRTIASQMAAAILDQVGVDIESATAKATMRASGSVVRFPGFLSVYQEGREDTAKDGENEQDRRLPELVDGQQLPLQDVVPTQHFTEPPPRYSEASLVKALEELGIGRPSTYASIMQVLQDRSYVKLETRRFTPEDRGRLVTAFLENYFRKYVEYDFTAKLEEQLDDVSAGKEDYHRVLRDFWQVFHTDIDATKELRVSDVLDALDAALGPHLFPPQADGTDPRICPKCKNGRLQLKSSRFGAFVGCSLYPACDYTRQLADQVATTRGDGDASGGDANRELGENENGWPISVRRGPYGFYVQLGPDPSLVLQAAAEAPPVEAPVELNKNGKPKRVTKPKKAKPDVKRVSLPRGISPVDLDLETAKKILTLPREVGPHPETGDMIKAGVGRFGPYLQVGGTYKSIPAGDDVLEIGINRAVDLLATAKIKPPPETVGIHPTSKKPILKSMSRFGPYIRCGTVMVTIPKDERDTELTLARAVELLATKKGGAKGKAASKTKKEPAEKKTAAVKTTTTKKPAAKKTPAQKTKQKVTKPSAKPKAPKATKDA